ncbi:MAG: radical SAM protein [Promethearchaeota archaeon]|nr:MAG: radical SAM protein [Candidatus Lokiarchaeota archaeon]
MMVKKILLIQPFSILNKSLSHILLAWPFYLENFIKYYFNHIKFEILYLPAEQKQKNLIISSYDEEEIDKFYSQMNHLVDKLEFEVDESTLILISCPFSHFYLPTNIVIDYFNSIYKRTPILVGGTHISACPNSFNNNDAIDYLIPGEGEVPLYNLLSNNIKKRNSPKLLEQKYIEDLNKLPVLDFSSLSINKYIKHFSELAIFLSRGCPFNCHFCIERNLIKEFCNLKKWRSYSPKRAVQEIENMVNFGEEHGISRYGFLDPIFGFNQKWLNSFLEKYKPQNSSSFWLETRLDILNKNILEKFRDINFNPWYGLEHTSYEMLKKMNKTNNPKKFIEKFQKIIKIHKELDFICQINVLLLHPGETKNTLAQVFEDLENMIIDQGFNKILLSIRRFHNYPGTYIFNKSEILNNKYGTIIYPIANKWWVSRDLNVQKYGEYCIKPSSELTLREGVKLWTEYYEKFNKLNFIKNKNKIKDKNNLIQIAIQLKKQNNVLEETKNDFIEFLNAQKIEI